MSRIHSHDPYPDPQHYDVTVSFFSMAEKHYETFYGTYAQRTPLSNKQPKAPHLECTLTIPFHFPYRPINQYPSIMTSPAGTKNKKAWHRADLISLLCLSSSSAYLLHAHDFFRLERATYIQREKEKKNTLLVHRNKFKSVLLFLKKIMRGHAMLCYAMLML